MPRGAFAGLMRIDETIAPLAAQRSGGRKVETDLRLACVAGAGLPWRFSAEPVGRSRSREEIVADARAVQGYSGALLLGGGEPLLRPDLLGVLADLVALRPDRLGVCTAGDGVTGMPGVAGTPRRSLLANGRIQIGR